MTKIEFLRSRPLPRWLIGINATLWAAVLCAVLAAGWMKHERERQARSVNDAQADAAKIAAARSQIPLHRTPDIEALRGVLARSQVAQAVGLAELEAVHVDGVRLRTFTLDNDANTLVVELASKDTDALQGWLDAINEGLPATRPWRVTEYVSNTQQGSGVLATAFRTPDVVSAPVPLR